MALRIDDKQLDQMITIIGPSIRFRKKYGAVLEQADNISLYLNANVVELMPDGQRITHARCRTFAGAEVPIKAKLFVLACGGIENARILLASNSKIGAGIGNQYDQVGRYFSDHKVFSAGEAYLTDDVNQSLFQKKRWQAGNNAVFPHLQSNSALCREYRCLQAILRLSRQTQDRWERISSWWNYGESVHRYKLIAFSETESLASNRIKLTRDRDELGIPRIALNYQPGKNEIKAIEIALKALSESLGRSGLGRVKNTFKSGEQSFLSWGYHHYATTRMHVNPKEGVVDSNCRVNEYKNLYIGGSSVFPSSGIMTPTLIIIALALRMSEHLQKQMES